VNTQGQAVGGGSTDRVMRPFETDNPHLQRLFSLQAFGSFPGGCLELLEGINNVAKDEQLITGLRVGHGLMESGVLMVTTHFVRYAKKGRISSSNKNELWDFGVGVEVDSPLGSPTVIRLSTGHQFQAGRVPVVSRRQAKEFLDVVKCVEGAGAAINGELEAAALESMVNSSSTAGEIKDLVALRDAGDLSQVEFEAAKARLLGS
jgi:hypothetical protein